MIVRVSVPVDSRAPGGATNAYLAGDLLVDPAGRTDELDDAIAEHGIEHVAVTHAHPDHVGGVADYAGGRTVWAHDRYTDEFESATGVAPDRTFREGDRIGPVEVLETPGHARDHVAFLREGAIVGDLAIAEGSVLVGGPGSDLRSYLVSLRRLLAHDLDRLHPGHGPTIDAPRGTLERLLRRRLDRERRVREAVEAGARTPGEIVGRAYDRDLAGIETFARLAVEAHLRKLDFEGAVEWDGERARPA